MERHGNMKMTVMEEEIGYIHRLLDQRHSMPGCATWQSAKVVSRGKECGRKKGTRVFSVTSAGMNDPGRTSRLRIR